MDIMSALADPVRREILFVLKARPLTAGDIAGRFPISRPAVSRHLRILREAGLVTVTQEGRRRIYRLETAPLAEMDAWLAQFRELWSSRFDALETEVFRTRHERRRQASAELQVSTTEDHVVPPDDAIEEQPA